MSDPYVLDQAAADGLRELLARRAGGTGSALPGATMRRASRHVRVTGAATGGWYPCVPTDYAAGDDAWDDSEAGVVSCPNGVLVEDGVYEAIPCADVDGQAAWVTAGGRAGSLAVQELDGSPDVDGVDRIKFDGATVTDNLDGSVTVAISGGGGGYTDEQAQDAIGSILLDSSSIDFTYDDATPTITAVVKASSVTNAMLAGSIAASKLVGTDIATVGTLTSGATGAGFTVAFGASTLTGSVPVANGGTGGTSASDARTNLGLAIGTDVQAYHANLAAIAGLTSAADKGILFTGSGTASLITITSQAVGLLDDTSYGAMLATLGGTTAGIAVFSISNPGAISFLRINADNTATARSAANMATDLGLGTGDSPQFSAINLGHASDTTITRASAGDIAVEGQTVYRAGGTDVAVADGGTGSSSASGARTNLGLAIGSDVQAYSSVLAAYAAGTQTGIITPATPTSNANQTTTSTTLADVPGLTFSVAANKKYKIDGYIRLSGSPSGGTRLAVNGPTGTLDVELRWTTGATGYTHERLNTVGASMAGTLSTITPQWVEVKGTFTCGGSGGTVALQFKSVTSGQTSTVEGTSYFEGTLAG